MKTPYLVNIEKKPNEEEAIREKEREEQLEIIDKIENEEKTNQQKKYSDS